jgi:hypothetical protein
MQISFEVYLCLWLLFEELKGIEFIPVLTRRFGKEL